MSVKPSPLCALACLLVLGAGGCGDDGETFRSVERFELVAVDGTRRTPPNGSFPGSPQRSLRLLIWRGQSQGHCGSETPLLLLLHGFGGLPEKFEGLARNLAAGGLTVVAVAFPLTNENPRVGTAPHCET
ncbi:MAG: hypothetical protein KatS3mg077_0664 [Candidatus Binatia bacterium]|nr:MAG: hypothetical protein KatS3mg077_0664 [Candidatus Binatia bacterium]